MVGLAGIHSKHKAFCLLDCLVSTVLILQVNYIIAEQPKLLSVTKNEQQQQQKRLPKS